MIFFKFFNTSEFNLIIVYDEYNIFNVNITVVPLIEH